MRDDQVPSQIGVGLEVRLPGSFHSSVRWSIRRSWALLNSKDAREQVTSDDLLQYRACGMLGPAGIGKSYEVAYLAELDRQQGLDVRCERLAVLGQSTDGLSSQLKVLAKDATPNTVIYLDAIDEVMVPVPVAALVVAKWIREELASSKPLLRLTCRSAVWPQRINDAIHNVYGKEACALAVLQPLLSDDVKNVASGYGVNADAFLGAVETVRAEVLSQQPLTLEMLLLVYKNSGTLPGRRNDLFARGIEHLAVERAERREDGTAIDVSTANLLEAAERLACFTLLSGREVIDLSDAPASSSLGWLELERLPCALRPLDFNLIRAVGRSGLCDTDGSTRFRFAHRQFAEYLAGRRLATLPLHQARSLLASGLGWQSGVAGPLREAAAFAAIESPAVAEWVADCDPEVIGLSDVADGPLRRRAALNLLSKFQRHEMTAAQIVRGGLELSGFQYPGAENDLRSLLRDHLSDREDVLECAVTMIERWNLTSMSEELADLMLDAAAPLAARKAAGYALLRMGTPTARRRLLPLAADLPDDPQAELKGLALRCNWPGNLTVKELLAALTPPPDDNYHGAYDYFFFELDHNGFDASEDRLAGLTWALQLVRRGEHRETKMQLVRRIAIAALDEVQTSGVADALAILVLDAAKTHAGSPLQRPRRYLLTDDEEAEAHPPPLAGRTDVRRRLIDAITVHSADGQSLWWAAHQTPGLLTSDDFPWLLERASDSSTSMSHRQKYAELARMLQWEGRVENIEAWLATREIEPIASVFPDPLYVRLDSLDAANARERYAEFQRLEGLERQTRRRRPSLCPADRVKQVLLLSETEDPRFFLNVCNELTLAEDSVAYGFERFLVRTPGWAEANADTRRRIVESAKRLLTADTDEPEQALLQSLNSICNGYMSALWLAMECDSAWVDSLPATWWQRWAPYILRELRDGMSSEPDEPKILLLSKACERARAEVRTAVEDLATSVGSQVGNPLRGVLNLLHPIRDGELDVQLCELLASGRVPEDRAGDVAQFVLSRSDDIGITACLSLIEPATSAKVESLAILAAVALLQERSSESWEKVHEFMRRRPDLGSRVMMKFAHDGRFLRREGDPSPLARLQFSQIGQLVALLMEVFPPDQDPAHEGAHAVGPTDSAIELRDQLISWLGSLSEFEAVEALRVLERQFKTKYPWLRHPRARAERSYRLSNWTPIPPCSVAELLAARGKRLIRSERDAGEGIVAAMEQFETRMHHDSPSPLERLWNRHKKGHPTPKEEEHVSDELCMAIRDYFRDYAITADREVQIFRRKLRKQLGGAPGSEVDLLQRVPAVGSATGDPIAVPLEVKLAHNPEARTGLMNQLVDRYMSQIGTNTGVFAVAYMGIPRPTAKYEPLWPTPAAAREELERQAREAMMSIVGLDVRAVVIDASLPLASKPKASKAKKEKTSPKRRRTSQLKVPRKPVEKRTLRKGAKKKSLPKKTPRSGTRYRRRK